MVALVAGRLFLFERDLLVAQPVGQFLKGQHRVHQAVGAGRLVLLGHAGADEDGLAAGVAALDVLAMRLHGGEHVGQVGQHRGEILLDQQVDRVAAGGNQQIGLVFRELALIFLLDDGCADGGFLDVAEAQLDQRLAHRLDAHAVVVGHEGGGQADIDVLAALQHDLDLFALADDLLGVLRTDHEAVTAQYALVSDNMRLIAREANGLHRAVADAFVAVFAVGLFKRQAIRHVLHLPSFFSAPRIWVSKNSLKFSRFTPGKTSSSTVTVTPVRLHLPEQKLPASVISFSR